MAKRSHKPNFGSSFKGLNKSNSKAWELILPYLKFSYNRATSKTAGLSLFKIVYGIDPLSPLDIFSRPLDEKPSLEASERVEKIKHLHEQVKLKTVKSNASY